MYVIGYSSWMLFLNKKFHEKQIYLNWQPPYKLQLISEL